MSKLVLHGPHGADKEFELDRERITIGRKAHSDIHLDASAVSGNHAVIITLGSDSFLEDLDSTNGTSVNQNSVHKCVLQDGDEIKIAHYRFTFVSEPAAQSAPGKTISATPISQVVPAAGHSSMALDADTLMPALTELAALSTPPDTFKPIHLTSPDAAEPDGEIEPGHDALGTLRILDGPGSGQTLELTRPVTALGKPGIQVAAITLRDGLYYLGVVEGDALPLINGNEINELPILLRHRDVISIAGVQLGFYLINRAEKLPS